MKHTEDMRHAHDLVAAGDCVAVANYLRQAELLSIEPRHSQQAVHTAA
jgi:hypothetical protein